MRWKLAIPLAAIFVIGLTFFSGPAIEETNAPPLVETAVAAEGMVPPGYAWHGNLGTNRWCLPNGNTGYEVRANSGWSPFEVTWSGDLPNGELSPGGEASGSAVFTWPDAPGESYRQDWSVEAKNCPQPTEEPQCTVINFDLKIKNVVEVSDTRAEIQAEITWDNGPNSAFIVWDFPGGRTDVYDRGGLATWELDRLDADYTVTVRAYIIEDETQCGSDSEEATIPARPKIPTPTPTKEPTPKPTDTPEPGCIITDLKGNFVYEGNHMSGNPAEGFLSNVSDNPDCPDTIYVHIFGSNQEPESDGWLESQTYVTSYTFKVPTGTIDMAFEALVPDASFCWYQVDLVRTSEVKNPPYYNTIDYVFVEGSCGGPRIPTCPECGPPVWEEMFDGGLRSTVFSKGPCTVCLETLTINVDSWLYVEGWDAGEWYVWYQGFVYEPQRRMMANGHEYSWVEIDLQGNDGNYIFLSKPLENISNLQQHERYDHDKIYEWVACSVAPGWQDTTDDGMAHFKDGHQEADWVTWLLNEGFYPQTYEGAADAYTWANALGEAGSLALPEMPST